MIRIFLRSVFWGLLFMRLSVQLFAQDNVPLLKGSVNISITNGTIECDLMLSNIPRVEEYVLRLNAGMNIRYFKDVSTGNLLYFDRDRTDTMSTGETIAYYFTAGGKKSPLPHSIKIRYVGMFPVMKDTLHELPVEDWRGNIAFNGYSIRADGHQSGWYPVIFDLKRQKSYEELKYNLTVTCKDCSTMYVNGCEPVYKSSAVFKCDYPAEVALYCGNYRFFKGENTYILNSGLDELQRNRFTQQVELYKKFYERNLLIPYSVKTVFLETTPTSNKNGFLFAAFPTIFRVGPRGLGFKRFFDDKSGDIFRTYIAHELGHFYFGSVLSPNTILGPALTEGFTEFLSLKLTRELISDSIYRQVIATKINALSDFTAVPFDQVRSISDYGDRELYLYYYTPLILLAVEKELGGRSMWKWLQTILSEQVILTDYHFLEKTLIDAVGDNEVTKKIKEKLFSGSSTVQFAIDVLNGKVSTD